MPRRCPHPRSHLPSPSAPPPRRMTRLPWRLPCRPCSQHASSKGVGSARLHYSRHLPTERSDDSVGGPRCPLSHLSGPDISHLPSLSLLQVFQGLISRLAKEIYRHSQALYTQLQQGKGAAASIAGLPRCPPVSLAWELVDAALSAALLELLTTVCTLLAAQVVCCGCRVFALPRRSTSVSSANHFSPCIGLDRSDRYCWGRNRVLPASPPLPTSWMHSSPFPTIHTR